MRKVIVNEFMSLDGVMQAPGGAEEDPSGGFAHGGGSTELVGTLIEHELVDEFRLMIDPVVLGGGKHIFRADGVLRALRLVDEQVTSTGAILATYAPAA